jgi:putative ABC transport system substrate-binding protein
MKRRKFIALLGCAVTSWPLAAQAQPAGRVRRVGMLLSGSADDREMQARVAAVRQGLQALGWIEGQNLHLDIRWAGSTERMTSFAVELAGLNPEVMIAAATTALSALQRATRTIPIVFVQVSDPVAAGFVASLARPGGNITGFTQHEFSIGVKWLELLKQIAPRVARVMVLYDPVNPATAGYLKLIETGASSFGVQAAPAAVRDGTEIERAVDSFAAEPNGGLILLPGPVGANNRDRIIALAARHRLPAVYPFRYHVISGGLVSYGIDNVDLYSRSAAYVDRILRGEKPAELPVQHATKFLLVLNLKTAKALGLDPPISLLARTDEVIE